MSDAHPYRPSIAHADLGEGFYDPVEPADFPMRMLRFRNRRAGRARRPRRPRPTTSGSAHFGRFEPLPDNHPAAAGHALSRPPVPQSTTPSSATAAASCSPSCARPATGRLLDLGTKGSGQTPWSRSGDGRLTLKGGVREVLATAMLEALGVPDLASLLADRDRRGLERGDEPRPTRSSVLTRLSHSHIRFGTFQRHAFFERADLHRAPCVDHVVETYYPTAGRRRRPRPAAPARRGGRAHGAAGRALDGRRLRARRAQHRQHEHHRRELRLRPLPLPAAQRPELHRRLFRPERASTPSAASRRRCSGTCTARRLPDPGRETSRWSRR